MTDTDKEFIDTYNECYPFERYIVKNPEKINYLFDDALLEDIESYFTENAYLGTIRINDVSIKERNIPLVKIERYKNDPFPVELIDENGAVIKVL